MRETLLAFIQSVQAAVLSDEGFRHEFHLSTAGYPKISFGYGYFDANRVLVWTDASHEKMMTPEEAVKLLLP